MARFASLSLVLLAAIALVSASQSVDLSHDFLEVDPMMNEYSQLSENGFAFTELGAEAEEAEADQTEETTEEEESAAPAAAPVVPAPAPAAAAPKPAAAPAKAAVKPVPAPAGKGPAVIPPLAKPLSGWAFRERGAPESVNQTELYSIAYDRLKNKFWSPLNISQSYPINGVVYMFVGGFATANRYFDPVVKALTTYGVPAAHMVHCPVKYTESTLHNAQTVLHNLNATYTKFKEAKVMVFTHSNGIVALHAAMSLFPQTVAMIHGVIALNPIWGGSVIATNMAGLPANVATATAKLGVSGDTIMSLTYASRQEFVRKYPIDYNQLRLLVVATHNAKPAPKYIATGSYVTGWSKEINDGVVTLSDQLVPGAQAIILAGLDHDSLPFFHKGVAPAAFDPVLAAQSYIYTFFKVTP